MGSTAITCCDGGDPAVWFTHSQLSLFASQQPNGRERGREWESVSRMQAEGRSGASTHARLLPVAPESTRARRGKCWRGFKLYYYYGE